jgi:rubredoxin
MKVEDLTLSTELVNGELVYIVDPTKFNNLMNEPFVNGISLGNENLIKILFGMMEFVQQFSNFSLALYSFKIGNSTKIRWMFVVLYKLETRWQRVHIHNKKCDNCGWTGATADPAEPSLYDTIPNRFEELDKAWKIPAVLCPKCNMKLQDHPIWVESLDT